MTAVEFKFNDNSTLLSFINGINIPALYKAVDDDKSIVADLIILNESVSIKDKKYFYRISDNNIKTHDDNTQEVISIHTIINCSNIKTIKFIEISDDKFHDIENPYTPHEEEKEEEKSPEDYMITWEEFESSKNQKLGIGLIDANAEFIDTNIKCPKCGKMLRLNNKKVFRCIPPRYEYKCSNEECNNIEYSEIRFRGNI